MKFIFKIDKNYLISHTFASEKKPFSEWSILERICWEKYKNEPAYYFLNTKHLNWAAEQILNKSLDQDLKISFLNIAERLGKIYKDIFKSKEFKRLYKETAEYLEFVKSQWKTNEKEALKNLEDILKIKFPNKKITVYITHPKLKNGKSLPKKNLIFWGHPENWKNYSTIYLCHELLHVLTWKKQKDYRIMHALIELATDEELRIRLNKRGKYFDTKDGHKDLVELKKKILPYWKSYLNDKSIKNIFELEALLIKLKF